VNAPSAHVQPTTRSAADYPQEPVIAHPGRPLSVSDVSASDIARRLERLRSHRVSGGLLSVEEAAALAAVGFEPVSEVIGAVAKNVRPTGFYASGAVPFQRQQYYNQPRWEPNAWDLRTYTSSSNNLAVGTPTAVSELKSGYRTALNRLEAEARAVGADGVVDVQLTRTVSHGSGAQLWSFLAIGTAVRSSGQVHTAQPFTSGLSAAQTAAAIRGGWLPVSILTVPVMGIRYVDYYSRSRRGRLSPNAEIDALTDAVNTTRHQARTDLELAARAVHADGAVMSSMSMEMEAPRDEPVCRVSVTITGTALARFRAPASGATPLMIMPLNKGPR
jgi:uncharacterized protein YbjQ (UPF0145 family)